MNPLITSSPLESESKIIRLSTQSNDPETVPGEDAFLHQLFQQDAGRACELLFRKYHANLCNHAIRFVYAKDIAEEIVAEVFANFWQNQAFNHIDISYQAYLYRAVRYRAYNYIRFELNRTTTLDAVDFKRETPAPKPDELVHYHDLCRKVDALVQQLPPQCRRAFQMNRLEGKKYAEVASELHITVSAVERLISRALAKLRGELQRDWLVVLLMLSPSIC